MLDGAKDDLMMEVGMEGKTSWIELCKGLRERLERLNNGADKLFTYTKTVIDTWQPGFSGVSHINASLALLALVISVSEQYKNRFIAYNARGRFGIVEDQISLFKDTAHILAPIVELDAMSIMDGQSIRTRNRAILSIDLEQPPEILMEALAKHIEQKQDSMLYEERQRFARERYCLHQQIYKNLQPDPGDRLPTEKEFLDIQRQSLDRHMERYRLRFDLRRSVNGNITRDPKNTFKGWWLYLRVYHARKNEGATWQEVVSAPWYPKNPLSGQEKTYVRKDLRKAEALIEAAWNNKPLAAVKLPN